MYLVSNDENKAVQSIMYHCLQCYTPFYTIYFLFYFIYISFGALDGVAASYTTCIWHWIGNFLKPGPPFTDTDYFYHSMNK